MIAVNWLQKNGEQVDKFEGSNMDWRVEKRSLFHKDPYGEIYGSKWSGMVREDNNKLLGISKDRYEIIQNDRHYEIAMELVDTGLWTMGKSGFFKDGDKCFITLHQSKEEVIHDDFIEDMLLVAWFHDGKRADAILPTSIRIICLNSFNSAIQGIGTEDKNMIEKVLHNSKAKSRYDEIVAYWKQTSLFFKERNKLMNRMADTKVTDSGLTEYADLLITEEKAEASPYFKNQRIKLLGMLHGEAKGHRELGITNTLYGAFNAMSEFIEYNQKVTKRADGSEILFGETGKQLAGVWKELTKKVA